MIKNLIDEYFEFRGYVTPNRLQALMFLLSEVGELVDAYRAEYAKVDTTTVNEQTAMQMGVVMGRLAESAVTGQADWVRNNDRQKAPDLSAEIGDTLMMLDRFSLAAGVGDPTSCLVGKMDAKGFDVGRFLGEAVISVMKGDG